jgi:hypothetical protein
MRFPKLKFEFDVSEAPKYVVVILLLMILAIFVANNIMNGTLIDIEKAIEALGKVKDVI